MTVLDKANAFIGHAEEVDEGYETTMRRNAFVAGYEAGFAKACEILHDFAQLVMKMRKAQSNFYRDKRRDKYAYQNMRNKEGNVDAWIRENYEHLVEED